VSDGIDSSQPMPAACNLCGGRNCEVFEEAEPPFRVLRCRDCTLTFVHPHPKREQLAAHYDGDYYREWLSGQAARRSGIWRRRMARIERLKPTGRLLDVGCGEGTFLALARERGWQIEGTEISAYASDRVSARLGCSIFCGDMGDAGYPENSFDVVTTWHTLEHMEDPLQCLRDIFRVLKPGGILVVAVPNVNDRLMSIAYRMVRRRKYKLFSVQDREVHLYHFSEGTIREYLERTGYDTIRLSPDYGIVDFPKRLINGIAVVPHYLGGPALFNAFEVFASPRKAEEGVESRAGVS
jgi:ubiquinone/menaquinone biosynthesis C-methylase UbiE